MERASLVIDLTRIANDDDDEVVEIPGFPADIPQTLIPLEEEVAPSEVCMPSPLLTHY